jgi:ribulose-bisphosphate carboxylase large chain
MSAIRCSYLIETPFEIERAVDALITEQTLGTFTPVPGETDDLRARFGGSVESIHPLESAPTPSLTGKYSQTEFHRAEVVISIPLDIATTDIYTLIACIAGNGYEVNELSGLRLIDFDLPSSLAGWYPGPQFGIVGCRKLTGVYDEPLIGTIIKPSVGLSPEVTADMVKSLVEAGIDFIKDDELMTSPPYSTLENRVSAVMAVINDHAERTGKKVMYAFNVSDDDLDIMLHNHDVVLAAGGTCIMASVNYVGVAAMVKLRQHSQLPIHGHRNGWGLMTRCEYLGWDYRAYQKLWRLVGVDQLHVNGIQNKFWESDDSVVRSIKALHTPIFHEDDRILPVVSSGQWGGQAPEQYRRTQTVDVLYQAGGGIMGHPGGPSGGVAALRQAWQAARQGVPLEDYAQDHEALRQSLEKFGKLKFGE